MMYAERLPRLQPAELDENQLRLYQLIAEGPRRGLPGLTDAAGALLGPFNAMLFSPAMGAALQAVGAALRTDCSLSERIRELAILCLAAQEQSQFEWNAHEPHALRLGWTPDQLAAIREGHDPGIADPHERAAWQAIYRLLSAGDLDDEQYREGIETLGQRGLVELSALIGYYRLLALQLRLFRVATGKSGER